VRRARTVEDYARAFIMQAKEHYGSHGGVRWMGIRKPENSYGFSYRIISERLKAENDDTETHQFDAWMIEI